MIGFPLGLFAANAAEWVVHKYVLHGLARNKKSFWAFHWHEHHRDSRRNGFEDPAYERSPFAWNAQGKELLGLVAGTAPWLLVAGHAPWFVAGIAYSTVNYYRVHKRSHRDPEWAREHLPWHYDHHMGPNQHANWCVTKPWFDEIMGTREPFVGTEKELKQRSRHRKRERSATRATA